MLRPDDWRTSPRRFLHFTLFNAPIEFVCALAPGMSSRESRILYQTTLPNP